MNIVNFIQQILCSVGIRIINRQDEFIQQQELQFRILQSFWSCSKQIQCRQEKTKRSKHYTQCLLFQDGTSQNLVSLEPSQSYVIMTKTFRLVAFGQFISSTFKSSLLLLPHIYVSENYCTHTKIQ